MKTCEEREEDISTLISGGTIPNDGRKELEEHLATCARCQETRADYTGVDDFFRAGLKKGDVAGSEARKQKILDRIRDLPETPSAAPARGSTLIAFVGLAILAVVGAAVLAYAFSGHESAPAERPFNPNDITSAPHPDRLLEKSRRAACEETLGLSDQQKAEWQRVIDEFGPRFYKQTPDGRWPEGAPIQHEMRAKLRAALHDDQQKSFDEFCDKLDHGGR